MGEYPDLIYIQKQKDGEDEYFIAHEFPNDAAEIGEEIQIAVYELKEIKIVKTEIIFK